MWLGHGGFLKSASLQNSLGHLTAVGAPFISRARFKYFKMTQRSLSPASLLAAVGAPEHSIGHKKFVHWYMRALLKISMAGIWFSDYGLNRSFGPFRPRRRRSFARWAGRWPTWSRRCCWRLRRAAAPSATPSRMTTWRTGDERTKKWSRLLI